MGLFEAIAICKRYKSKIDANIMQRATPPKQLSSMSEISGQYDAILCDVWGVLHNGVAAWAGAVSALQKARSDGLTVVMITNAPRPNRFVLERFEMLNIPNDICDGIISSGDVTVNLVDQAGEVFHVGPDKDSGLFDGENAQQVFDLESAKAIVCTGLYDDLNEHPTEYHERMKSWLDLSLPMICANPDIVVEMGDKLLWCAGALAREYVKLGGKVRYAGKPYAPIYEQALALASELAGKPINAQNALAIGDGQPTDVLGANNAGLDLLFVSNGIHVHEYGDRDQPDLVKMTEFLAKNNSHARYTMPALG